MVKRAVVVDGDVDDDGDVDVDVDVNIDVNVNIDVDVNANDDISNVDPPAVCRFALSQSCLTALHGIFAQSKAGFASEYRRKVEYEYVQAIKGGLAAASDREVGCVC